jgi:hypothetical protein
MRSGGVVNARLSYKPARQLLTYSIPVVEPPSKEGELKRIDRQPLGDRLRAAIRI